MRAAKLAVRLVASVAAAASLSGCLAATAVGVAGAAVGVTAKAASETVHVGHVAVDAVTGSGKEQPEQGR